MEQLFGCWVMEHVQVLTLKCELMAFLVHLDYIAAYFRKRKNTNAQSTSNIYALAAQVSHSNSYFIQRWA